jgi:cellulose synthase/poly-beta-1,6-N-acetylglucosamine synthase-like glycosyltransferase
MTMSKPTISNDTPSREANLDGMTMRQKMQFTLLVAGGLLLTITFAVWWFRPEHIAQNFHGPAHIFDVLIFIVLSYIVWQQIVMEVFAWYVAAHISHPDHGTAPSPSLRVAYATAFVPGSEPYDILERTLAAMVAVDYPHDTWLLDEGNDDTAKALCEKYGVFHFSRKGKSKFNTEEGSFQRKTKGGNYNSWLHHYKRHYDILAQHDVDFIPRKDFLMRTLGYFSDSDVAFVGTPQIYGNLKESWIAHGAAQQTWGFYGFYQKGFFARDMTLLVGANHILRVAALDDIGGYMAHITEDMLTGMKLYTHQWKSIYVPEILLVGEGPSTWAAYFGQQMRWAYGCMDIFFRHAHELYPKLKVQHIFNYLVLQQFYFSGIAQFAGIVLLTLYFIFGISPASMTLLPILLLWVPLIIYQVLVNRWLQRFNIDPQSEHGLLWRGRIMFIAAWPIYFLAFIGVMRGKRLTYVVTPKGDTQATARNPSIFIPHFLLGSVTLLDVIAGYFLRHDSGQLVFWALLNTALMYGLFYAEALPVLTDILRRNMSLNISRNMYSEERYSLSQTSDREIPENAQIL